MYQETTQITLTTMTILITLRTLTNLTILTDQKNYQDDKCRIRIDYFVMFALVLLSTWSIHSSVVGLYMD